MAVPFVDLRAAYLAQEQDINTAVSRVLNSGQYILGTEVEALEHEFAALNDSAFAVGVASGTDALLLALKALEIGPGDEVITVSHTAVATVTAVELSGARPVFVDVDPGSYTLDPALLPTALTAATRAIIPVHLYGQPADLQPILDFAQRHSLFVIEDCAQAHGATDHGHTVGSMGHLGAYSFYPTKNLGGIGDGGATVCQNPDLAERLRALRQYGWHRRYISDEVGMNSRLDELQAAILRVKLQALHEGNLARRQAAARYAEMLAGLPLQLPRERPSSEHVFHLYAVLCEEREALRQHLSGSGIGTAVHYPVPVHRQPAYQYRGYPDGSLPVTEQLAAQTLSLPMFPQITVAQQEEVAMAVRGFFGR